MTDPISGEATLLARFRLGWCSLYGVEVRVRTARPFTDLLPHLTALALREAADF